MTEFVSKENHVNRMRRLCSSGAVLCCCAAWLGLNIARAQVFTVGEEQIPSRYSEIKRTHVDLPSQPLLQRTKLELVRVLESEQGFAMRPLPKGPKGMVLQANGIASPNGNDYVKTLEHSGIAFQAADRVQITDMKIFPDKIVFELDGGPDKKHRILRHISIGVGGMQAPLARDDGQEPMGVRLTLQFEKYVPEMTGTQVKELLEPLVDFKLKSPVQAYTDTLPTQLREAILAHHVLVGMNAEMVRYALGQPDSKIRERDGQMPFEEWIYGEPPKDVEFVRFNGNRVIQVEDAKLGQPPIIRNQDEMGDYWGTAPNPNIHEVKLGDVRPVGANSTTVASAPPTLRKPGETLPIDSDKDVPSMQKVQFPPGMDGSGKPANPPPSTGQPTAQPGAQPPAPAGHPAPNPDASQYRAAIM
jgi:hypothetical protein